MCVSHAPFTLSYGEMTVFFFPPISPSAKMGRHLFSPAARKRAAPKNGGAASRTLTPAHGALSGILGEKVRQRTAARPKYNPAGLYLSRMENQHRRTDGRSAMAISLVD